MVDKLSSLDINYQTGDLSVYPESIDTKETLYEVKNNALTKLKQGLTYNAKIIVVEDASKFPEQGLLRIGSNLGEVGNYEIVYYAKKINDTFQDLKRGFVGTKRTSFESGALVANAVMAEPHNAVKDALINMEVNLGLKENPTTTSLNGILISQETRFYAPKPLFRAFPIKGSPPHKVRFQNFTTGNIVRFLWDFGDGGISTEQNPIHTYLTEGIFTVKLNVITGTGAQGSAIKSNYITVDSDESTPFFYLSETAEKWSTETANYRTTILSIPTDPTNFTFVDQTDGDVVQRNWDFGDGNRFTEEDPDIHQIQHIYSNPGEYIITLIILFANGRLARLQLPDTLIVL